MADAARAPSFYVAVWRWHFYAGLLCIPFVLWLALTGALYLWRPQAEAWLDRGHDRHVTAGTPAAPDAQVAAALRAVPGSTLHQYLLPEAPGRAVRILVTRQGVDRRVYVDPATTTVLGVETEEARPFRVILHLHGELLAGSIGSYLVEIAACWTIVMLLTGLYLWWPRARAGLAGVLYPRWRAGGRRFWRDLHAVTGIWVSVLALGLIVTGLPWAAGWGNYLAAIRTITGNTDGAVDWTIGGQAPDPHAAHRGMTHPAPPVPPGELARVIRTVRPLAMAPPVAITPPVRPGAPWTIASQAADRPERSDAAVDGASGRLVSRIRFGQRHWIDRAVGYGVAVHEGALFGLANQLLGTLTALALVLLAISGAVMWWRRRPMGLLGAPLPKGRARFGAGLVAGIVALALYLPMFGMTLLGVVAGERLVLRRLPAARRWLGLPAVVA